MKPGTNYRTQWIRRTFAGSLWRWLFVSLLAFNLVIVGFDLYPKVERKLARRNIGQIPATEFSGRVRDETVKLLNKHDARLYSDESRLRVIDYITEARDYGYRGGLLAEGLVSWCMQTNDPEAFAAIKQYGEATVDARSRYYDPPDSVNDGARGCPLLFLAASTKDERYQKASDELAGFFLAISAKHSGLVPYTVTKEDQLILIDTIGLMCPFLARYSAVTGKPEALDLAIHQIDDFMSHGMDTESGLPFHGYNQADGHHPVGVVGWGRGLGWLVSGVGSVLDELPLQDPRRERLMAYARRLAATTLQEQRPDGVWGNMLSVKCSAVDTSATAMITLFLLRCRELDVVGSEADANIQRAVEGLRHYTRQNGVLDFAQGDVLDLNRHSRNWEPTMYGQGSLLAVLVKLETLKSKLSLPVNPTFR